MIPDSAETRDELIWQFIYWLEYSNDLRQNLWAHQEGDIATGYTLLSVLSVQDVKNILRYLIKDYWKRYLGWPEPAYP
jgi:hypothetical protein